MTDLQAEATMDAQRQLCAYIKQTWVESTLVFSWYGETAAAYTQFLRVENNVARLTQVVSLRLLGI